MFPYVLSTEHEESFTCPRPVLQLLLQYLAELLATWFINALPCKELAGGPACSLDPDQASHAKATTSTNEPTIRVTYDVDIYIQTCIYNVYRCMYLCMYVSVPPM